MIYTLEEAAEHFKMKPRLLRQMVNKGWPHLRINRIQIRFTEENLREIEGAIQLATVSSSTGRKTK